MQKRNYTELKTDHGTQLYYRNDCLSESVSQLEYFLSRASFLNSLQFAKRVMFSSEIRSNNSVEGYIDDVEVIERAIRKAETIEDLKRRARIVNLYKAYDYILNNPDISPQTLKELYSIISQGLLTEEELQNMGPIYRQGPVYIFDSDRLDKPPAQGILAEKIEQFMDSYFAFLQAQHEGSCTDDYIRSQILHFYFVYIHPFFDVNGRTGRTLSMWYLLNKKAYSYIIFNRGLTFNVNSYYWSIRYAKRTNDITYFLSLMLETVKKELEKEFAVKTAVSLAGCSLTATEYQALLFFLSMKGQRTIFSYAQIYNQKNPHKKISNIYSSMIEPLLDKGILEEGRPTGRIVDNIPNKVLKMRKMDIDPDMMQYLQL